MGFVGPKNKIQLSDDAELGFRCRAYLLFCKVAGLDSVDANVLESAKGMGLTSSQILRKVQMPLAWPIMLAGIRVSALLTVGISAIATLVAGGGLGDFIKSGLARLPLPNSLEAIWTGVMLSLALALAIDLALRTVGRFTNPSGVRS